MKEMPITVAMVDDDADYAEGVRHLLEMSHQFECVAVCGTAEEALKRLPQLQPRIVLMDIQLPGMSGPECVAELKDRLPDSEILMLTVFEEYDRIYEALVAGATGYLLKRTPPGELLEAIEDLHNGGSPMSSAIARKVVSAFQQMRAAPATDHAALSQREEEILRSLARGRRYKEIAYDLKLSYHTVRTHLQNVYKKLHVKTRGEAVRRFQAGTDKKAVRG